MLEYANGGRLVQSTSELPDLRNAGDLFADFETTSLNDEKKSLNPWRDCWALGVAVTTSDAQGAWYVPVRHRQEGNVPLDAFQRWWHDIVGTAKCWTNHNVKYDAHVSSNDLGWAPDCPLYDTVTHAKIIDSDRQLRGGYGLDALSLGWLGEDIRPLEDEIKRWLGDSQDYGRVHAQPMGEYACQDVLSTRRLKKYIEERRHSDCHRVAAMETELTGVLYRMERNGMLVLREELILAEIELTHEFLLLDAELAGIVGRSVNPSSNDQLYDLLINQYGLPILGWTEEDDEGNPAGNASFDKEALARYAVHPLSPKRVIALVSRMRSIQQTLSLFVKKYQDSCDEHGRLHPNVNQSVRTGRLSMKDPNLQQCSKVAKRLIHPAHGNAFLSADQSQIEFRVIVHYIENQRCIDAYLKDPDTDFHQWMADTAGMKRKPAKTLNFQMGYGGGKKKAVRSLSVNSDVVGGIEARLDELIAIGQIDRSQRAAVFEQMAKAKAEGVYDDYHRTLPELKPTSRRATAVCKDRGYVRNVHGRHRHLPAIAAHKAFNSLCQGEAADIQKERTCALDRAIQSTELMLVGNVHDETVIEGPDGQLRDPRTQAAIAWILETPDTPLRVPLRCSVGYSEQHWAEASTDVKDGGASAPIMYDRNAINKDDPLCHLK